MIANKISRQYACLTVVLIALLAFALPSAHAVHAAPIQEVEPNDSAGTAQPFQSIGTNNSISAAIDIADDHDWYSFVATEGQTYVIEIFNAAASLGSVAGGQFRCNGNVENNTGLGLIAYDASVTLLKSQCTPRGAGNVHNILEISPGLGGTIYIQVIPGSAQVTGNYTIRVLPKYNDPTLTWDPVTFEPNNRAPNAYAIGLGAENALQAAIEERIAGYSTNDADVDWYRFEAVAGQTYVIELFNVAASLGSVAGGQFRCNGNVERNSGLGLIAYDASVTLLKSQCTPRGAGNVHNILEINPGLGGTIYVQVIPGAAISAGTYSIRVLPQYSDSSLTWDPGTFEPNNRAPNAYNINVGQANMLKASIEQRIASYSTNDADVDWYRFEAAAGKTYIVELLNVSPSLTSSTGGQFRCDNTVERNSGLGLVVYDASVAVLKSQCRPMSTSTVHNSLEVTPGNDGILYVQVVANAADAFGNYSIRVRDANEGFRTFLPLLGR